MNAGAGRRTDAHLHLWDLAGGGYAWLATQPAALRRTFTPEQAWLELQRCRIDRAVLVQAADCEPDTELMLQVAREQSWVAGVVGWVQLDDPTVAADQLDRWQEHPAFCGVRHLVHADPRADFLRLPAVRQSLALLAERGIAFDVPDAWPRHLGATAELAAALPDLRIVVDHLGKPPFGREDWQAWRGALGAVAAQPNTSAKVSGLQVPGRAFTVAEVRPAWESALELFGPGRLMWGSDWPLTVLVDGYQGTWQVMAALLQELSGQEQARILDGTATAVYRLRDDAP